MKTQNIYECFERLEEKGKRTLVEWLDFAFPYEGYAEISIERIELIHFKGTNFYLKPVENEQEKICERCGERPGTTNSHYVFDSPISEPPDLGDWVCDECESELEREQSEFVEWLHPELSSDMLIKNLDKY